MGHKPFQLVDGDRFVFNTASALVFTGMGTDTATRQQEGVTLTDGVHSTLIVALFDLANIARNIDLGRAGLLAGRQGVIFLIEMQQALRHGAHTDNILRTGLFTGSAPHTHGFIHDRKAVRAHMDSVEAAGRNAVALSETADAADPMAAVHGRQSLTAVHTVIKEMVVGTLTAGAFIFRHQGLGTPRVDTHYPGHGHGGLHPGDDTDAGRGLAVDDGHGCRRTAGVTAATAIGAGEKIFDLRNARVLINVK